MLIGENAQAPFFKVPPGARRDIIHWWEQRRVRYNLYVGLVGFVSLVLVVVAGGAAVRPGEDFEEPIMLILGPVLYAILANIFFTLGWIVDVAAYKGRPRQGLFKAGLIFSLAVTALPGIWAVVALLITVYTGHKLD